NNYNGSTMLNGGTLQLSDAGAIANSALFLNGGMLQLRGDANTSFANAMTMIGADSTIDVNQLSSGSNVQLSLGATTMGAFTLNVTGANNFGLGLGPVTLTGDAVFNPTTADLY